MDSGTFEEELGFLGFGSILYNLKKYDLSLRCYFHIFEMRKKRINFDQKKIASLFNNIGCCVYKQGYSRLAYDYFNFAKSVFYEECNLFDENILTVNENIKIISINCVNFQEFPKVNFKFYYEDNYKNIGIGGKRTTKKKTIK